MTRAIDPARLQTLARDCGAWLEIRVGGEILGTVRGDLVRALLRVKGASWTFDDLTRRLICSWTGTPKALGGGYYTNPGGRYSLRIQPPGAEAVRRSDPRPSPTHYTPAERAELDRSSIGGREAIEARIKAEQKAARLEVARMEQVKAWNEELGAWFPAGWDPDECRAYFEAHPDAYQKSTEV